MNKETGLDLAGRAQRGNAGPGINWPDPVTGPWQVKGYWRRTEEGPELIGVEIWRGVSALTTLDSVVRDGRTMVEPGGFDAATFRELKIGEITQLLLEYEAREEDFLREWYPNWLEQQDQGEFESAAGQSITDAQAAAERWASTPNAFGPTEGVSLEAVRDVYLSPMAKRRPTKAVADHFHVSHSTAQKLVRRCRDAGLIAATTPGRTSGKPKPTPKKRARRGPERGSATTRITEN